MALADYTNLLNMPYKPLPAALMRELDIQCEMRTDRDIKDALWQLPANMELAKLLISKRMGLRIALGEVTVNLKKPVDALKAQGRSGVDALALLAN